MDVCEKMQLQALRMERFIERTLTVKEQKLQVGDASKFTQFHPKKKKKSFVFQNNQLHKTTFYMHNSENK